MLFATTKINATSDVLQDGLHAAHDERQADERERNQHRKLCERALDTERHEIASEPAGLGIDGCQCDAGNRGLSFPFTFNASMS
jgi:hypothetical protein